MSIEDGFLDNLRKKQARERESVGLRSRMKEFFKRNSRRFSVAGILATIFSALALTPGVGYIANAKVVSARLLIEGHPCYGYLCNGTMSISFNRFCYPANHLFGSEVTMKFTIVSEPYDSFGESVEGILIVDALLSEFPINLPLFFVIGYIIAVGLDKSIHKMRRMKK